MRTNKSNINKTNNMTVIADLLREDCKKLVSISKNDRDKNGKLITYEEIGNKNDFFMAYKKAKLHFSQLAKTGEEGKKIAHVIFGSVAHDVTAFRCAEKYYLRKHPEDKGFFNVFDYYDYARKKSHEKKIQNKIAAENSAREEKRVKAVRETGRRNRTKVAIAIIVLIAVAAFVVAVYKKGLKPVCKAIAYVGCCFAVILSFRKAQEVVLKKIHKRFYGNK